MKKFSLALAGMVCCALPIMASVNTESDKETKNTTFPDSKKYYRLRCGNNRYLTMKSKKDGSVELKALSNIDESNVGQIWNFTATTDGKFLITTQHRSMKNPPLPKNGKGQPITVTEEDDTNAESYVITVFEGDKYTLGATGDAIQDKLHNPQDSEDIVGWGKWPAGSQWQFEPVVTINTIITAAGYSTVNYPFAVQLPEDNIKAYYGKVAKVNKKNVLALEELTDKIIPANMPVVLEGDAKTYSLTILDKTEETAATQPLANNQLSGTYMPKVVASGITTYALGMPSGHPIGFYKLEDNGTNRTLSANKAYLSGSNIQNAAANTFGFSFSFDSNNDETTGIIETQTDLSKEEFFDLQGRRVMNPSKGIFVTKNGKKILFAQ